MAKKSVSTHHTLRVEYSEFEKFLLTYKDAYPNDVRQLVYRLDIIKRDGAADRHFRYEGTKRDRVMALPSHLETTSLRLYLLKKEVMMKTNRIMDEIRSTISPEMKLQMELSVAIANCIYQILEAKGMSQKEFAHLMGKTETEVSRWLSGTHNLTMATICKISAALEEDIIKVADFSYDPMPKFEPMVAAEPTY